MVILINSHTGKAIRCSLSEARRFIIESIESRLKGPDADLIGVPIFGEELAAETVWSVFDEFLPDGENLTPFDLSEAHDDYLVVPDEGEGTEGVAVGFSSAGRCSFHLKWPLAEDEEEFLGNGDPMVYKTAGIPAGVVVIGEEIPLPEES